MSRTHRNRGISHVDFYPTPSWCVHRLLEAVRLPGGFWLEPAVGDGAIVEAVNELRDDVSWTTVDVRDVPQADLCADFIAFGCPEINDLDPARGGFDVVITNPPFSQASEFVQEALRRSNFVAMLLRLGWLASATRSAFLRLHPPDVYVLPDRPSFRGNGGTDSTDYAWMVWPYGASVRPSGRWQILPITPVNERRGR